MADGAEVPKVFRVAALWTAIVLDHDKRVKGENLQVVHHILLIFLCTATAFGLPSLVSLDEFGQVARLLRHPDKLVLQQLLGRWTLSCRQLDSYPGHAVKRTSRGSRWRQYDTNSLNDLEKLPSKVGGGFLGIRKRT